MKRTSVLVLVAAALAVCMVANSAQAGILYAADFNSLSVGHSGAYATSASYVDGPLVGQDGWTLQSSTVNPLTVSNAATDGKVAMANNGQDAQAPFAAVTSGTITFRPTSTSLPHRQQAITS